MKKIDGIVRILALLLCAATLCSCAGGGKPAAEPTAVPLEDAEDLVLFRNGSCVLSVASIEKKHSSGTTVTFSCENLTSDTSLGFQIAQYAVNRFVIYSMRAPGTVVFAKGKGTFEIVVGPKYLQEYGVEQEELEICYRIVDDRDETAPPVAEGTARILLREDGTEEITVPEPMSFGFEDTVLDDGNARAILYNAESWEGTPAADRTMFSIYCYLENKTDKALTFTMKNVVMDGKDCPEAWNFTLYPHMRWMGAIDFSGDFFRQSGLDSKAVGEIGYTLEVSDAQGIGVSAYSSVDGTYRPIYPEEAEERMNG